MKNVKLSQKLTESGLMLALTTILSIFAIAKLPYGGEITLASMLPTLIIAYRYGFGWGALTGVTYGLIQMLLGLNNLSYATSAAAVIAIIVIDYLLAFSSVSAAAWFRRAESQRTSLALAALTVCLLRYLFHVISGCTVWAGLSIPTADALFYSVVYNATYMLPETIITVVAAVFLGSSLNFRTRRLTPVRKKHAPKSVTAMTIAAGLVAVGAVAVIIVMVFPHLQDAETGEFSIQGIENVNKTVIAVVVIAALAAVAALYAVSKSVMKKQVESR